MLNLIQRQKVKSAINDIEKHTTGKIYIHICKQCEEDVFDSAKKFFISKEMHKTHHNNAVLIYIAEKIKNSQF